MSLKVPSALLERAQANQVTGPDFLDCIATSLPYAWNVITRTAQQVQETGGEYAEDNSAPPTDAEQGQLLRLLASSSMRTAMEEHLGVRIEFQNCCKVAVFNKSAVGGSAHAAFVSPTAQLLNQAPALVNC